MCYNSHKCLWTTAAESSRAGRVPSRVGSQATRDTMAGSACAEPFQLDRAGGRLRYFWAIVHPRTLLASDAQILAARDALRQCERSPAACALTCQQRASARVLVDSAVHPDTGAVIPRLFRRSAFVPGNLPIVLGMLLSPATAQSVALW
jgi:hypothetical protein